MTLIKCSQCEHTISSVASRCPNCGALLTQYRFVQGQGGSLTECRRCARKVLSGAMTCPYCGVARPGRRMPYVAAILVVALAAPVALFAALYSRAPAAASAARSDVVEPTRTVPQQHVLPPAPPRAVAEAGVRMAQPVPDSPAGHPSGAIPPGAVTKWTLDWANVREGRALGTTVIAVLRPGEQVMVGDRQAGWWALYRDSKVLGYVAGSVLGGEPPAPLPTDSVRGAGG